MAYEFDTTVLGGLPVTVAFDTTDYDNRDVGMGVNDVDDWWITAVGGKSCKKSPAWLYKRISEAGEEDDIITACYEYARDKNGKYVDYDGDGLKCPVCGSIRLRVLSSRDNAHTMRRRRECKACKFRFYTKEVYCNGECIQHDDDGQ